MPKKIQPKISRKSPIRRSSSPKVYYPTFGSLVEGYTPKHWIKAECPDGVTLSLKDGYDQPRFEVGITRQFTFCASYYGWKASSSCFLYTENIQNCTLTHLLSTIECTQICPGMGTSGGVMHIKTKSAGLFSDELLPSMDCMTRR